VSTSHTRTTASSIHHHAGEEDSADLRVDSPTANALRERLTTLANDALRAPLREGEDAAWGIGPSAPVRSVDELLAAIDRGNHAGGPKGRTYICIAITFAT